MKLTLITVDQISKTIHKSRRHTLDVIVKQPGFPAPIVPGRPALWDEAEVMNFFLQSRKKTA